MEIGKKYPVLMITTDKTEPHLKILPVYPNLHNDVENGQREPHYHVDTRFIKQKLFPTSRYIRIRLSEVVSKAVVNKRLIRLREYGTTTVNAIASSNLKYNCIYKGKCPHRGFDLANTQPVDGVITCPLHGLQFDADTKQLLTNLKKNKRCNQTNK